MFEGGANTYNNWVELVRGRLLDQRQQGPGPTAAPASTAAPSAASRISITSKHGRPRPRLHPGRPGALRRARLQAEPRLDAREAGLRPLPFEQFRTWSNGDGGYFPAAGPVFAVGRRPGAGPGRVLVRGRADAEGPPEDHLQIHPPLPGRGERLHHLGAGPSWASTRTTPACAVWPRRSTTSTKQRTSSSWMRPTRSRPPISAWACAMKPAT